MWLCFNSYKTLTPPPFVPDFSSLSPTGWVRCPSPQLPVVQVNKGSKESKGTDNRNKVRNKTGNPMQKGNPQGNDRELIQPSWHGVKGTQRVTVNTQGREGRVGTGETYQGGADNRRSGETNPGSRHERETHSRHFKVKQSRVHIQERCDSLHVPVSPVLFPCVFVTQQKDVITTGEDSKVRNRDRMWVEAPLDPLVLSSDELLLRNVFSMNMVLLGCCINQECLHAYLQPSVITWGPE